MDESLKALQLINRSLLAVSAALLVFSISVDRGSGQYEGALAEFKRLQSTIPRIGPANIADITDAYANSQIGAAVLRDAYRKNMSVEHMTYSVALEERDFQFSQPMYTADSPQRLDDWYKYIKTAPRFDSFPLYHFDDSELRVAIADLLDHSKGVPLSTLWVALYVDTGGSKYKQIPGKCTLEIPTETNPIGTRTYSAKPIRCQTERRFSYKRAIGLLSGAHLYDERDGYILPLPALSRVWDDVTQKEMTTVEGVLERKATAEKLAHEGSVSVIGLSLNARATGVAGPIVELLLVLYLLAHIRHISSLAATGADKIRSFPDIGIVAGALGTGLMFFGLIVLPLMAGNAVIVQSFPHIKTRAAALTCFSVPCLVASIWAAVLLKRLEVAGARHATVADRHIGTAES